MGTTAVTAPKPAAPAPPSAPPIPELSALGLTTVSVIALDHRPTAGKVSFSFTANVPARVLVTLSRKARRHHRTRWATVGRAVTISATVGRNVRRLAGSKRLPRGTYRLTLAPSGGKARSVFFHIG